jgi:hypothetical protein
MVMGLLPPVFFAALSRGMQFIWISALRLQDRKHRRRMERAETSRAA